MQELSGKCARSILETVPLIMRAIKPTSEQERSDGLSVPQFGALMMIKDHEGASVSFIAKRLRSTLPSTSKLVDTLVERGYVTRETAKTDRRRMILNITEAGETSLRSVQQTAAGRLAQRLTVLSEEEHSVVIRAMELLQSAFAPSPEAEE